MSCKNDFLKISPVLDKIVVRAKIHQDTYATAVGTATPLPHPFDGSDMIIFHVCQQIGYVMKRAHY
jgi:hypothetical protein